MHETPETMAELQRIIDESAASAGRAVRQNFAAPGWRMTAEEFVAFWIPDRMASIATSSEDGSVHAAPLEPKLIDGRFIIPTFPDSQRLRDHRARQRCVITSWDGPYRAVIVYGEAREIAGEADGAMVMVEITPTRIYAIRPPAGHPSLATA
jgi:hypothetical protein